MNKEELEKRLAEIPEVEPDEFDLAMIAHAEAVNDGTEISLEEFREMEKKGGRLSVRLPKSLHIELLQASKREGVSLNMYVACQLAKSVGRTL